MKGRPIIMLAPNTNGNDTTRGRIASHKEGNKRPSPFNPSGSDTSERTVVKINIGAAPASAPKTTDLKNAPIATFCTALPPTFASCFILKYRMIASKIPAFLARPRRENCNKTLIALKWRKSTFRATEIKHHHKTVTKPERAANYETRCPQPSF